MDNPRIFISYSRQDEAWKDRLLKHLNDVSNEITIWHDRKIKGGDNFESQILEAMNQANLAILLVTSNFFTSEFISQVEVPRMLERHRAGALRLYPIIVSECEWKQQEWLRALNCRPTDGKPLETFFPENNSPRGEEQLVIIADEIAELVGVTRTKKPRLDDEIRLLAELVKKSGGVADDFLTHVLANVATAELVKKSGGVAEPPQDLTAAIHRGLADVSEVITELTARSRSMGLELDEIEHVVSTAIGHGAGVYNHSSAGRVGCARIYHRAASGLLELMPAVPTSPDSRPPRDVELAAEWLRRIVMAVPLVHEPIADDLAWELRWVFDSLHQIPICDRISDVLASLSLSPTERKSVSEVVRKVLQQFSSNRMNHVAVYVLRHTAQVLLSRIAAHHPLDGDLINLRDRLKAIQSAHPRITRTNLVELATKLPQVLEEVIESLNSEGGSPRRSWQRWINPRVWFSQN